LKIKEVALRLREPKLSGAWLGADSEPKEFFMLKKVKFAGLGLE